MTIETKRLRLYPISDEEMEALIAGEQDPEMKQAYSEMLQGCTAHPQERIWYAVWNMELKKSPGIIVGDFCFKGVSTDGATEIGYGLRPGFCGKGYMTEAVTEAVTWALHQPGVIRVEAETAPDNSASQRVLLRVGFCPNGERGEEGPRFVRGNSRLS